MAVVREIYAPNLWEVKLTQLPDALDTETCAEGGPQLKVFFYRQGQVIVVNSYMLGSDIV